MKLLKNKIVLAIGCFFVLPFLLGLSLTFADIDHGTLDSEQLAELE